jgi:hypothetical protein
MNHFLEGLGKIRRQGRLAVAAQRHVAQLQQLGRQRLIQRALMQPALQHVVERPLEFHAHDIDVQRGFHGGRATVHFAVQTVEVAQLVGIQVHAQRQPVRA